MKGLAKECAGVLSAHCDLELSFPLAGLFESRTSLQHPGLNMRTLLVVTTLLLTQAVVSQARPKKTGKPVTTTTH